MREDSSNFWNQRYIDKDTPWDSEELSVELEKQLNAYGIRPEAHPRILDIGCGTGTNAICLAQRGFQVTACDISAEAIRRAKEKAAKCGAKVDWIVGNFLEYDWHLAPFPVLIDRGCYHIIRQVNGSRFLQVLDQLTHKGSLYFVFTGNAYEPCDPGPPVVKPEEMLAELGQIMRLKELREFRFDGVQVARHPIAPLGWSAVWETVT